MAQDGGALHLSRLTMQRRTRQNAGYAAITIMSELVNCHRIGDR
jgi:hypothetical protein